MAAKKYKEELLSTDMERCIVLLSKSEVCVCTKGVEGYIYQVFNSVYIWEKGQRF